ncbi:MAG: hypothetical protein A3J48_02465 [Candidatus Doudnabacteria bacterium RIFCSPHIGHO2_02_FULL_46_11]|uniref:PKD domain-containing protein n=1 Tax=Candidatus Doudnabacteria bacterium RIFCSPHIGHO2_02_FULL_46_11 TaxID=1817832 RepID=A0A1F5P8X5_9BACT|nr:MAG: hypothetical protein A3J48_02465 [Candidatus Doudnabacteria bacterium RIFCSPHIGHO2_02_FULL_46_11]
MKKLISQLLIAALMFSGFIFIKPAQAAGAISISPTYLPNAMAGQYYSTDITFTYEGQYALNAYFTGLPAGITTGSASSPNTTIGILPGIQKYVSIRGTPTQAGSYNISLTLEEGPGTNQVTKWFNFIVGVPASVDISTQSLPDGKVGTYYSAPINFAYNGSIALNAYFYGLPPGLTTGGASSPSSVIGILYGGAIYLTGTPTQAGTYSVSLTFEDGGHLLYTKYYTIKINENTSQQYNITPLTSSLPDATVGNYYLANFDYRYYGPGALDVVLQSLPVGIGFGDGKSILTGLLTPGTGEGRFTLIGTPTQGGTYNIYVVIRDPGCIGTSATNVCDTVGYAGYLTLKVKEASTAYTLSEPVITGPTSVNMGQSNLYNAIAYGKSSASNPGYYINYTYDWGDGSPKASKAIESGYSIYHSWQTPGTYIVTVTATDSLGKSSSKSIEVKVFSTIFGKSTNPEVQPKEGDLINDNGTIYKIEYNLRKPFNSAGIFKSRGYSFDKVRPATETDRALMVGEKVTPKDGALVNDRGTIYYIDEGYKRPFNLASTFLGFGYKFSNAISADVSFMGTGSALTNTNERHPRGSVVVDNGTVYYIGKDIRYPHPTPEVFLSWGNKWEDLVPANQHDLALPLGPTMEVKK